MCFYYNKQQKGVELVKGRVFFAIAFVCAPLIGGGAFCATQPNPRTTDSNAVPRRSVGAVQSRSVTTLPTRIRAVTQPGAGRSAKTITAVRTATVTGPRSGSTRSAVPSMRARSAKTGATNARTGKNILAGLSGGARSAMARATAVFSDVSKIGSGYAACRESYATCMDQICASANDSYRRCVCSDRYTKFRNIEDALDQAMIMLAQFQDNNLNVVDKTAAEVDAMYSATVGEMAIKSDTSAAAKMLDEISNLLSGKSTSSPYSGSANSLGILDLDFSTDLGDIWSNDVSSVFSSSGQDMSTLEGVALFNAAQNQCVKLSQDACENDAAFSMSRSSYNILINQDCNLYETKLNKNREKVAQAIRLAEQYLREARLEEYRSHNSADVNECIAKVRSAILADTACGENYKRCLDPTGAYINGATGEAIYSPRLFQLEKTISLEGVTTSGNVNTDVLGQNKTYDKFLENYRQYVVRELDTCRDIADFVWTEFKRNAIIEIAQAQSEKLEEVKSSCVNTIAECYDTQTNALKNVDKNTATAAGALGRYTARDMCAEQVSACATLYGSTKNNESCKFDSRGHLTSDKDSCGLTSLLNYVKAVDDLSVAQKCEEAVEEYVTNLCTPDSSTYSYPYNCRKLSRDNIRDSIQKFAIDNCYDPGTDTVAVYSDLPDRVQTRITLLLNDIDESMNATLADECSESGGMWSEKRDSDNQDNYWLGFYNTVYGGYTPDNADSDKKYGTEWGYCYANNPRLACLAYADMWDEDEDVAEWDMATQTCVLYDAWYRHKCQELGSGYYLDGVCYISSDN